MKRLYALPLLAFLIALGGCVAVPYDTDSVYYSSYPSVMTAEAYGSYGYAYPDRGYPYAVPRYGQPYPYSAYPYYQPPAYSPPAPIIVPPPLEFRYRRDRQPGWDNHAPQRHDQFRNGPRPDWNHGGTPQPRWEYRDDGRRNWQQRNWQPRGNHGNERPNSWQQEFPRGGRLQR